MLKALSLWQPYAGAIPLSYKTLETRSWPTSYRGKLLIASTASNPGRSADAIPEAEERLYKMINKDDKDFEYSLDNALPYLQHACALAICDLVDCYQIAIKELSDFHQNQPNGFLGDFTVGRWIWELENIQPLTHPIPNWKGKQGLYNVTPEQIDLILKHNPTLIL